MMKKTNANQQNSTHSRLGMFLEAAVTTCIIIFTLHLPAAYATASTRSDRPQPTVTSQSLTPDACAPLRSVSFTLVETGKYYVVARMRMLANRRAAGSSRYVAAYLLASGPQLDDWKILTADAGINKMTRLCVRWGGHGVRVRAAGRHWPEPGNRVSPVDSKHFPGCGSEHPSSDDHCQTLRNYLQRRQRPTSLTLLLRSQHADNQWLSMHVGSLDRGVLLRQHQRGGEMLTRARSIDFTWKPNLDQALPPDPMLPLASVDLRQGNAPALPPPAHTFARMMHTDDNNYDLDLFWTGPGIHPVADARRAAEAYPPRAYEVEVLGDNGVEVLDTLYTYRPYLKYVAERQKTAHGYPFEKSINLRIRTLGNGCLPGRWRTYSNVPIRRDYPYVIGVGGQSNIEAWFNHKSGKTRDLEARNVFRRTVARTIGLPPYDVAVFNVAQGGSAVDRAARSTPTHYWYNLKKSQAGPLLRQALKRIAMWKHVDLMLWAQGERETFATALNERHREEPITSPERWLRATKAIFTRLRHTQSTSPSMPIVLEGLGRFWFKGRQVHVRERNTYLAQQVELVKSQPRTWFGADASAFALRDYQPLLLSKVHYGPGMYYILAKRMGRFVGRLLEGGRPVQRFPTIPRRLVNR